MAKEKMPFELQRPDANTPVTNASEIDYADIPLECGLVYDISVAHAVNNVPAQYASLSAALGTSGTNIPQDVRRGGMAVKFINSGTGKYEQWVLKASSFSTIEGDWQGVDEQPEIDSHNLVESGGTISVIERNKKDLREKILANVSEDGVYFINEKGEAFLAYKSDGVDVALISQHFNDLVNPNFRSSQSIHGIAIVNTLTNSHTDIPSTAAVTYGLSLLDVAMQDLRALINALNKEKISCVDADEDIISLVTDGQGRSAVVWSNENGFDVSKIGSKLAAIINDIALSHMENTTACIPIQENIISLVTDGRGRSAVMWSEADGFDVNKIGQNLSNKINQSVSESASSKVDSLPIQEDMVSLVTDGQGKSAVYYSNDKGLNTSRTGYDLNSSVKNSYVKNMEDWRDLGVGMFIHWGLYSITEGHYEGLDRNGDYVNVDAAAEEIMIRAKIPVDTYRAYMSDFTASHWDADAVARLAYETGMRYIVITVKHAEGFHLYPTQYSEYNVGNTPAPNTIIADLKAACDKYGLKFCIYFNQKHGWIEPGGYGSYIHYTEEEHKAWVENEANELAEICADLKPYALWFDTGNNEADTYMSIINDKRKDKFPQVIIDDRLFKNRSVYDYATGEGGYYNGSEKYAENCYDLGYWGYSASRDTSGYTQAPSLVLCEYVLASAARGQNVLLNVGPKGDGSIPELRKNQLLAIGDFFAKYGSLAGCRGLSHKAYQNWGMCIVYGRMLRCFVMSPLTAIKVDGILTKFIKDVKVWDSNNGSYSILSDEELVVEGIPTSTSNSMPRVVDVYFGADIVNNDYTIITDNYHSISVLSFWKFSGCKRYINPDGVSYLTNFSAQNSYLSTRFKNKLPTGSYLFEILQSGGSTTVSIALKDEISGNTESVTIDYSLSTSGALSLTEGHIYMMTITKAIATGYINIVGINILNNN